MPIKLRTSHPWLTKEGTTLLGTRYNAASSVGDTELMMLRVVWILGLLVSLATSQGKNKENVKHKQVVYVY